MTSILKFPYHITYLTSCIETFKAFSDSLRKEFLMALDFLFSKSKNETSPSNCLFRNYF